MPANIVREREKALLRPVTGPYPELARELRRLLGHDETGYLEGDPKPTPESRPFYTARQAFQFTEVSYTTISRALAGERIDENSLLRLAWKLGGDARLLFRLSGWPDLPPRGWDSDHPGNDRGNDCPEVGDGGEEELLRLYRHLAPDARMLLIGLAQTVKDYSK